MTCYNNSSQDLIHPKRSRPINSILAVMPNEEFRRISGKLELCSLSRGQVLFEPNEKITHVYFPTTSMVSLVSFMNGGKSNEIGIIGREGMIGLPVVLGGESASYQAVVQIPGRIYKVEAQVIHEEFCCAQTLHDMLLRYSQALMTQLSQTAVANARCTIDSRLAQWLLIVHNSVQSDYLPLTHEFIAEMLGTRRASVTTAANKLQKDGAIKYSRGKIVISSREKLEAKACDCFFTVQKDFCRLIGETYSKFCSTQYIQ